MRQAGLMVVWVVMLATAQATDIVLDGQLCELIDQPLEAVARTHPGARLRPFDCNGRTGTVIYPEALLKRIEAPKPAGMPPAEKPEAKIAVKPQPLTGQVIMYNNQRVELVRAPLSVVKLSRPADSLEPFVTDAGEFTIVLSKPVAKVPAHVCTNDLCEILPTPTNAKAPVVDEPEVTVPYELINKQVLKPEVIVQRLPDPTDPTVATPVMPKLEPAVKPKLRQEQFTLPGYDKATVVYGTFAEVREFVGPAAQLQAIIMDGKSCFIVSTGVPAAGYTPTVPPASANIESFLDEVGNSSGVVLVYFSADWCGNCRAFAPTLYAVAAESHNRIKIVKVDVDRSPAIAHRFGVTGLPSVVVFKDGKNVRTYVGAVSRETLRAADAH